MGDFLTFFCDFSTLLFVIFFIFSKLYDIFFFGMVYLSDKTILFFKNSPSQFNVFSRLIVGAPLQNQSNGQSGAIFSCSTDITGKCQIITKDYGTSCKLFTCCVFLFIIYMFVICIFLHFILLSRTCLNVYLGHFHLCIHVFF